MKRTEARISELREVTPSEHRGHRLRASGTCQADKIPAASGQAAPREMLLQTALAPPEFRHATATEVTSRSSPLHGQQSQGPQRLVNSRKPDSPLGLPTGVPAIPISVLAFTGPPPSVPGPPQCQSGAPPLCAHSGLDVPYISL